MPVIWEHVIIDSPQNLSEVAEAIEGGPRLGRFTHRLEVRIPSRYSLKRLINVIKTMHGLKVFIVGQLGPTTTDPPPLPTALSNILVAASPTP